MDRAAGCGEPWSRTGMAAPGTNPKCRNVRYTAAVGG